MSLPSKEEIIAAIQQCAARLGRAPHLHELRAELNVNRSQIRRTFGSYRRALAACDLRPIGSTPKTPMDVLFHRWAELACDLGRIPTSMQYDVEIGGARGLRRRFSRWAYVAPAMKSYATEAGLAAEWADVLALVSDEQVQRAALAASEHAQSRARSAMHSGAGQGGQRREIADENWSIHGVPTYGAPINSPVLLHAPTNEMGVLILFASLAVELGYRVRHVRSAFPDCEALRRIDDDHWQPVKIEFELLSRNFLEHGHDPAGCDLIVCWKHNWPECPVRVLELCRVVERG